MLKYINLLKYFLHERFVMFDDFLEGKFRKFLKESGITINGDKPWDIQVSNKKLYGRILRDGTLGLGEAYMDGWWECAQIDEFINKLLSSNIYLLLQKSPGMIFYAGASRLFNLQTLKRAFHVAELHYDLDNNFFKKMLDKRMIYTCGYWKDARNLDLAEEAKLDLVCRKAGLKRGMKILDIGCGWGGFAKFAAEKYGVEVVGITISKEQYTFAQEACKGLSVEIRLQDYRKVTDKFDRIISIGMFEAVGPKNYKKFMRTVHNCLKDDGIFILHTIGGSLSSTHGERWIEKYIFPNGVLPSIKQIGDATEGLFVMEDWHNFGPDYDKTLMAWYSNFEKMWPDFESQYGERFYRMWKYYLLVCAGSFRCRMNHLWQIVLSRDGIPGGFDQR